MSKSLALGNGNVLVCLDRYAQVRDFYFPFVGLENHIGGHGVHRVGIWTEGLFSWLSHPSWQVSITSDINSLSGITTARNGALGVELSLTDLVYNEKNIFLRRVILKNSADRGRVIKLFFGHEFEIYESHRGDTAYFDPLSHAIIHYNGRRVFLINGMCHGRSFDSYTTGIYRIEGKEGSHVDAHDGILSENPIEHGPTDSVIGFYPNLAPGEEVTIYYWMAAGESVAEVHELQSYLTARSPDHLIRTTRDYWNAWINKQNLNFFELSEDIVALFKRSLVLIRSHADNRGGIIASGDSDMLQNGRDTYDYVWPRDAAYAAMALNMVGDQNVPRRFFEFCNDIIGKDGYLMHKYRPDRSLGSSWEPWIKNGKTILPIQEDETALVIYALWKFYSSSKDLEFVENIFNSLIKLSADFMADYRDPKTGLPRPSYDLWEEKHGISTYTASAVYGALIAAARFAKLLGKEKSYGRYWAAAEQIKNGILEYLYDRENGVFYKLVNWEGDALVPERTIDSSSAYGVYEFGVLPPDDDRLYNAIRRTEEWLTCRTPGGGVARYEGDRYFKIGSETPGNPWFITTLWMAQYDIARAKTAKDFDAVRSRLAWVTRHALPSGILSEQLNPYTGDQLAAAPLTWSHAEFVITIIKYLYKLEELGICEKCNPLLR